MTSEESRVAIADEMLRAFLLASGQGRRSLSQLEYAKLLTGMAGALAIAERRLDSLSAVVREIEGSRLGWWWTCGNCKREAHATIGPESGVNGPGQGIEGFAESGDVAGALRNALDKALKQ